jgi:hypothetical protein
MNEFDSPTTIGGGAALAVQGLDDATAAAVRGVLLRLARVHDEQADQDAARTPYWAPCPDSVVGCRAAAQVLRATADSLLPRPALRTAS